MKNYLKNALIGLVIGLILIPITCVELYCFGDEITYITEVINFKNFMKFCILMPVIGILVGLATRFLGNFLMKFNDKEVSIKKAFVLGLKFFIYIILIMFLLSIVSELLMTKLSETVITLIIFNTTVTIIVLMIGSIICDSNRIRKINKKLKSD